MAGGDIIVPSAMKATYDNFHFAPAVRHGDRVFCSGQIGTGPGGTIPEDPTEEFKLAFEQVKLVLAEAGLGLDSIIEMTTYHVDMQAHLPAFMAVKDQYISEPYPAWTAIGISALAIPGARAEIRVIAAA